MPNQESVNRAEATRIALYKLSAEDQETLRESLETLSVEYHNVSTEISDLEAEIKRLKADLKDRKEEADTMTRRLSVYGKWVDEGEISEMMKVTELSDYKKTWYHSRAQELDGFPLRAGEPIQVKITNAMNPKEWSWEWEVAAAPSLLNQEAENVADPFSATTAAVDDEDLDEWMDDVVELKDEE